MKTLTPIYIVFVLILMTDVAVALGTAADSALQKMLILKKTDTEKTKTLYQHVPVTLYLKDGSKTEGTFKQLGDTFVIVDSQLVSFKSINKIKYKSYTTTFIKISGYSIAATSVLCVGGGFLLMYLDKNPVMPVFGIMGVLIAAAGMYMSPLALISFFPYRKFNLQTKWQIIPSVK